MAPEIGELLADLRQESEVLLEVLADLDDPSWNLATPSVGWSVTDQITHLAFFDDVARLAATDSNAFRAEATRLTDLGPSFTDIIAEQHRAMTGRDVRSWFERSRHDFIATFSTIDPTVKLPWFGPPMAPASSATARLMETWAHGLDVAETVGARILPSPRLRHIAHLGVRTFGFTFANRGLPVPDVDVRVELESPVGGTWAWGDPDSRESVQGDALDFCLVVTQRRNVTETALVVEGPVATAWLSIAQAFAGPPGTGRAPAARSAQAGPR